MLINADHMDIVGHYKQVISAEPESGRKYDTYDLLESALGFDSTTFEAVWDGVSGFYVE
jgi:hypothetical protein